MALKRESPPVAAGGARNCDCLEAVTSELIPAKQDPQALQSRATLTRRWPCLRVNRQTWRWRDDASGAHGDDLGSLLVFLNEGGVAR
jgi:hypothetical protein